jgi:hypothetical protein
MICLLSSGRPMLRKPAGKLKLKGICSPGQGLHTNLLMLCNSHRKSHRTAHTDPEVTMIDLSNKVIAITGAASGIGRATALLLASLGAKLSLGDLQQEALEFVAKEIKDAGHGVVLTKTIDVRKADSVESWITETVQWGGRLDGAANLAGVIGKSIGLSGVCFGG